MEARKADRRVPSAVSWGLSSTAGSAKTDGSVRGSRASQAGTGRDLDWRKPGLKSRD